MVINLSRAKSQLTKLIEKAMAGEEIVIAKRGKPVVRLVPIEQKSGVDELFGCMKGEISYEDGWDAPLEGDELYRFSQHSSHYKKLRSN